MSKFSKSAFIKIIGEPQALLQVTCISWFVFAYKNLYSFISVQSEACGLILSNLISHQIFSSQIFQTLSSKSFIL